MVERFRWWWITCHTYASYHAQAVAVTPSKQIRIPAPTETLDRMTKVLKSMPSRGRTAVRHLCAFLVQRNVPGIRSLCFTQAQWRAIDECANISASALQTYIGTLVEQHILEQTKDQYRFQGATKALLQELVNHLDESSQTR
jgi:hypothetical protein